MRLAILGLCLLAACVPAYSMASGTMDCIQGLVALNKGVCLAQNLTSCSSECQQVGSAAAAPCKGACGMEEGGGRLHAS